MAGARQRGKGANMPKAAAPHLNLLRHKKRKRKPSGPSKRQRVFLGIALGLASVGVIYVGILAAGFYAVKFHITDVPGVIDPHSQDYDALARSLVAVPIDQLHLPSTDATDDTAVTVAAAQDACQLKVVQAAYPKNAARITAAQTAKASHNVVAKMVFAVRLRSSDPVFMTALNKCLTDASATPPSTLVNHADNIFPWVNREEWGVAQAAFKKDAPTLHTAATVTGVEGRMIVAAGFVEQMRLYFTQREVYEKFFRPLKVLGNATQFAWGVMAIKEAAALDVERHLKTHSSSYYLGPQYEHALDFSTSDQSKERFTRLTDEKNHLFSYLYGGFELAQYRAQWKKAGFPIDDRPEILATLYNIGFGKSKPSDHPQVGGSTLHIADTDYTFGALAFEFYYSGEMMDVFPYTVPSS